MPKFYTLPTAQHLVVARQRFGPCCRRIGPFPVETYRCRAGCGREWGISAFPSRGGLCQPPGSSDLCSPCRHRGESSSRSSASRSLRKRLSMPFAPELTLLCPTRTLPLPISIDHQLPLGRTSSVPRSPTQLLTPGRINVEAHVITSPPETVPDLCTPRSGPPPRPAASSLLHACCDST